MASIPITTVIRMIKSMPKTEVEEECHAWGCCTPHYKYLIDPETLTARIIDYKKRYTSGQTWQGKK